jgi:hypothetical protein
VLSEHQTLLGTARPRVPGTQQHVKINAIVRLCLPMVQASQGNRTLPGLPAKAQGTRQAMDPLDTDSAENP